MNRKLSILFLAAAVILLCACGRGSLQGTGSDVVSGSAGTVNDVASGSAVKKQVTLELDIDRKNKISIPDPAKIQGDVVKIKLQKESTYEEYEDEQAYIDYENEEYRADLSFAGFEKEVFVSSYVTGNMTTPESDASDCLALFVHEKVMGTGSSYDEKNYFLVLDYGTGTCYKTETKFFLHSFTSWTELKAMDVTGDGTQEIVATHIYNKSVEWGAFRCDEETHKLVDLFSTLDDYKEDYVDRLWFSGHPADDYKVVLEFPEIGYSETVSMIEDGGYKEEDLQVDHTEDSMEWNPVGLWKDGKLQKDKVDEDTVFLYTLDHVDYVTTQEGNLQIELVRGIYVGHRSEGIGNMHIFLHYDAKTDRMILDRVKYVDEEEAQKEWKTFHEWDER